MDTAETACGVAQEYQGAELGDQRLSRRVERVAERLEAKPNVAFPLALVTEAELEGFYRLVNNKKVTPEALLEPHRAATLQRMASCESVLVVHDTTELRYTGDRADLGRLQQSGRGYLGHFALAVSGDERHDALGVLCIEAWRRIGETPTAKRKAKKLTYREARKLASEESRWRRVVDQVEDSVTASAGESLLHIMDSEGDDYRLLAHMTTSRQRRFVLRAAYDRRIASAEMDVPSANTREFVAQTRIVSKRKVTLARRRRRPGGNDKRTQERQEREATVSIRAASVKFKRPSCCEKDWPAVLDVNIVLVQEMDPPADAEPVEWVLITTEPIATRAQVLRVVDAYRGRWVIEEYFKALKTGCAAEKRQADSWHSMLNVLAMLVPIAWSLLRLRTVTRCEPSAPAAVVLTPEQIEVLRGASTAKLPRRLSARDAMLAVARLGGHLRSNGEPGWLVLGRGYAELLSLVAGYRLAAGRSDR